MITVTTAAQGHFTADRTARPMKPQTAHAKLMAANTLKVSTASVDYFIPTSL
jgi:hypothetical protein